LEGIVEFLLSSFVERRTKEVLNNIKKKKNAGGKTRELILKAAPFDPVNATLDGNLEYIKNFYSSPIETSGRFRDLYEEVFNHQNRVFSFWTKENVLSVMCEVFGVQVNPREAFGEELMSQDQVDEMMMYDGVAELDVGEVVDE
jgi:hypothetical protein